MRIMAAVVTYNRLNLLPRALDSVVAQGDAFETLCVINNCSTDGTKEFLESYPCDRLRSVNVEANLGGAGGFSLAVQLAVEGGYDAVWVFDDDGVAQPGALRQLAEAMQAHDLAIANALVLGEGHPDRLAFGLVDESLHAERQSIFTVEEAEARASDGIIRKMANPFNSTLISCAAVRKAGSIRPEMFIWGDEVEFMRRLLRQGFMVATVVGARHVHPLPKTQLVETKAGAVRVPPAGRGIYFYRNQGLNSARHEGVQRSLRILAHHLRHAVARKASIREVLEITLWWCDGLTGLYMFKPSRAFSRKRWSDELAKARLRPSS